jgi:glycosyltransferase involved in cell wall biosynthesis
MVKVSTIIPAYNAERTIARAIDSAIAQDYKGQEIVVVDDGSADSTASILERYANQIKVISQTNRGVAAARNMGVRRSSGKYLAFLDSDDVWLSAKLETLIAVLEQQPQASLAFSDFTYMNSEGVATGRSCIDHAPSMEEMLTELPPLILPSTSVIPRHMFDRTGGFPEVFKRTQGCEDSWMLLLLRELGEFIYVPRELVQYEVCENKPIDKYFPELGTFIRLLDDRYAQRAKTLIQNLKVHQCQDLLSKTAHLMNDHDKRGAIMTLLRIARFWPAFFLTSEFRGRLLLPQNVRRLRNFTFWNSTLEERK